MYRFRHQKIAMVAAAMLLLGVTGFACAPAPAPVPPEPPAEEPAPPPPPTGNLSVAPAEAELAFPGVFGAGITFTGSGFGPTEMVTVDMEVPAGVEINGVEGGYVGLAQATTDSAGNFEAKPEALTMILTLLRGEYGMGVGPIMESFGNPLPAGTYNFVATGVSTGTTAKTTMKFLAPAPPEE